MRNPPEYKKFYVSLMARIDGVEDLMKVCLWMMLFIEKKGLWKEFTKYAKSKSEEL